MAEWLKLTFPEYRSGSNINVSATAVDDQHTVVVTEAKRAELQARLKAIQMMADFRQSYDDADNMIETHEHKGIAASPVAVSVCRRFSRPCNSFRSSDVCV